MNKQKTGSLIYYSAIFLLMLTAIICYKPSPLFFIPLLVSVIIMFLQSKVNRYAFLLGAINSLIYAVAYVKMSLYSTALYAFIVSCPLQLMTFVNWSRHTERQKTELRQMSVFTRLKTAGLMAGGFVLLYVIFYELNSKYLLLDNCISIIGTVASILCLMRFKEYVFLQIVSSCISLMTFIIMLKTEPSRIIWVINAANSVISSYLALKNINKIQSLLKRNEV